MNKRFNNKRNNKKRGRRGQPQRYTAQRQLGKTINLYNLPNAVTANINSIASIFTDVTTSNYSFSSSSDVRFLSFSTLTGSTEMSSYVTLYEEYRIKSCTVIFNRYQSFNQASVCYLPALYMAIDPLGTASNPTNLNVLISENAKIVSPVIIDAKAVTFTFPGVSTQDNIWQSVGTTSLGAFYIGSNNANASMPSAVAPYFDLNISLEIEFRGSRNH